MALRYVLGVLVLAGGTLAYSQSGPPKPLKTPKKTNLGWWSGYPPAAFDEARRTGKPIVVYFR